MQKRQLKFGWGLILIWAIALSAVMVNYHNTEAKMDQVEQLGDHIEEFRSRLFFDSPYRIHLASQQVSNLNKIAMLRDELAQTANSVWFTPDIEQLLFTTELFLEQSRAFIGTEIALIGLIDQVQSQRANYIDQPMMADYYFRLSAYVFEALFSAQSSTSMAYRDIDNLYSQSLSLHDDDKQPLQLALAKTSQVMGSYAQGSYLVAQMISHSVHSEVAEVENHYHRLLEDHLILGTVTSCVILLTIMALWHNASAVVSVSSQRLSQPYKETDLANTSMPFIAGSEVESDAQASLGNAPPITKVELGDKKDEGVTEVKEQAAEPEEVDFQLMLSELGDDRQSLCMLLDVFIEDHQNDVADIARLIHDAPEEAIRKAHSLKGVGGNLGAANLRDKAGKVEEAILNNSDQVADLLVALDISLSKAIKEAQAFLAQDS